MTAPKVVRFRPATDTTRVARDQVISVRFDQSMHRASTKAAFEVTADGAAVKGTVSFAEDDTVLVFDPAKLLPYDTKIVDHGRRRARRARTARPCPRPAAASSGPRPSPSRSSSSRPPPIPVRAAAPAVASSGGSVGGGSWASVERYYLGLMNCTRTGGWVDSGGHCDSPGGRNVAPLSLSSGISSKVARPYAKLLATRGECSHFIGGNPGDRLRRAGYDSYRWAENIGCRSGQRQGRRARQPSLLPEREVVQRRPLRQHDEHQVRPGRDRRLGLAAAASASSIDFYHP